jgi:hypothetical protein
MSTRDYYRAMAVGFAVFAGTLLLSIPMVAVYAQLINPGHSAEFYRGTATWIAPWSSHIGGPILVFWLTRRQTSRHPQTNAVAFAWAAIASYVVIDLSSVPIFGLAVPAVVTMVFGVSLAVKSAAAFAGAILGSRQAGMTGMRARARG